MVLISFLNVLGLMQFSAKQLVLYKTVRFCFLKSDPPSFYRTHSKKQLIPGMMKWLQNLKHLQVLENLDLILQILILSGISKIYIEQGWQQPEKRTKGILTKKYIEGIVAFAIFLIILSKLQVKCAYKV